MQLCIQICHVQAQRDELEKVHYKLQQAEVVIAQEMAANKSFTEQLQVCRCCCLL